MTIANNYAPIRTLGNGVTTQFGASWAMINSAYSRVYLEDAVTGALTGPLTIGPGAGQYQIAINASGFVVTYGTAPSASQYAVISRSVTQDQTTPYSTSTGFQGKVEENSFDKLTAMIQDNAETLDRAILVPIGDTATNITLPSAALRANGFLSFDGSGNVVVVPGVSSVPVSAAMTPVVQAATLALARTAMGVPGLAEANTFTLANVFNALLTAASLVVNGTANVIGNFTVNTNKMIVNATSGDTTIAGTLGVTGQVSGPSFRPTSTSGIIGTTTNDNAAAGSVGEQVRALISGVNFPTSGQYGDAANFQLTAGDWDIGLQWEAFANGATMTNMIFGISTTSGNSGTGLVFGDNAFNPTPATAAGKASGGFAGYRVSLSGTTTFYVKHNASYSVATPNWSGRYSARRIR